MQDDEGEACIWPSSPLQGVSEKALGKRRAVQVSDQDEEDQEQVGGPVGRTAVESDQVDRNDLRSVKRTKADNVISGDRHHSTTAVSSATRSIIVPTLPQAEPPPWASSSSSEGPSASASWVAPSSGATANTFGRPEEVAHEDDARSDGAWRSGPSTHGRGVLDDLFWGSRHDDDYGADQLSNAGSVAARVPAASGPASRVMPSSLNDLIYSDTVGNRPSDNYSADYIDDAQQGDVSGTAASRLRRQSSADPEEVGPEGLLSGSDPEQVEYETDELASEDGSASYRPAFDIRRYGNRSNEGSGGTYGLVDSRPNGRRVDLTGTPSSESFSLPPPLLSRSASLQDRSQFQGFDRRNGSRRSSLSLHSNDSDPAYSRSNLETRTTPEQSDREGASSRRAIVIEDSPTPPLRPLASDQARAEAEASGRCGVYGDQLQRPSPEKEEAQITLGELVCPICLGPPNPLVITECGHAL